MKYLQILLFFLSTICGVLGQSPTDLAKKHGKSGDFRKAAKLHHAALLEAEAKGDHEIVYQSYSRLQECYTSLFVLDSAALMFLKGEQYALKHDNMEYYFNFFLGRAEIEYIQENYSETIELLNQLVTHPKVTSYHRVRGHMRLASLFNHQSNAEKAFSHIEQCLEEALLTKDTLILGGIYESCGTIERTHGSKYKAINFYQKAIPFFEGSKIEFRLSGLYRKISSIFQSLGNLDKAAMFAQKSLDVAIKYKSKKSTAYAQNILGEIALERQQYEKAEKYFFDAVLYLSKKNMRGKEAFARSKLAEMYILTNEKAKAKEQLVLARKKLNHNTGILYRFEYCYNKALYEIKFGNSSARSQQAVDSCRMVALQTNTDKTAKRILLLDSEQYKKTGNYKKALEIKERYYLKQDTIRIKNQSELVHDLDAKYKKAEQDAEIATLNIQNAIHGEQLKQQKRIIYIVLLGMTLLTLLGFFLYRLYRKVNGQKATIEKALTEKELLLREIHHRVKNNLQVISSLLALQSGYIRDDKAVEALKHGQDRVQSMALIHQDLYQTDNLKGVNTQTYFENLIENLFESYQVNEEDIEVTIDVEAIMLDVDSMIPLGLIVNELVSNVLKHAFVDRAIGKVEVSLKERAGMLYLEIKDNGVGMKDINDLSGDTFGFQMIKAFANKLKAKMEVDHKDGLTIRLAIKNYMKAA